MNKKWDAQKAAFWAVGLLGVILTGILVWINATTAPKPMETVINFDSVPVVDAYPELAGIKINVNTASESMLMLLPGIGENTAKAIIEYREIFGSIKNGEQMLEIMGIGEGTLAAIEPYIEF